MDTPQNIEISALVAQTPVAKQAVVLLHGIWVSSWVMNRIASRLMQSGYAVYKFSYRTVKNSPHRNAQLLADFVDTIHEPVVHFVAHSLGGLVLLQYFNRQQSDLDKIKPGRAVFLGSPLLGSNRAPRILKVPFGKNLLGKSVKQGLLGHGLICPSVVETGMIAGTFRLGVGQFLGTFGEPNDGTVAVRETRLKGLTDHICMRVSHTGMLTSSKVMKQIIVFLQQGAFKKDP